MGVGISDCLDNCEERRTFDRLDDVGKWGTCDCGGSGWIILRHQECLIVWMIRGSGECVIVWTMFWSGEQVIEGGCVWMFCSSWQ